MPVDDVLAAASLPEVTVDTEGALARTRQVGGQRRRRRSLLAGAGVVLVVLTSAVAGRELVGGDDEDRVVTGPDPSPTRPVPAPETTTTSTSLTTTRPVETPGTTPGTTSTTTSTSTSTSGGRPVGSPPDLDACTRESVAAAVGYRMDEVLSDPVCHEGWGWIDACTDAEADPVDGCIHVGKIIRVVADRWIVVEALLQDCAESFTRAGAPPEVAERFYPRCFPDEQG